MKGFQLKNLIPILKMTFKCQKTKKIKLIEHVKFSRIEDDKYSYLVLENQRDETFFVLFFSFTQTPQSILLRSREVLS